MRKKILLVALMVVLLVLFCGCSEKSDYVSKNLSNTAEYTIEYIWIPQSAVSSNFGNKSDIARISENLAPFVDLDYTLDQQVSESVFCKLLAVSTEKNTTGAFPISV